jgi:uncharacterized protein
VPTTPSLLRTIETEAELRTVYKQPTANVVAKNIRHIDKHFRRFIELSPFVCMGSMGPDGIGDVTPRGGEPGFVQVFDETTLIMPDRPGNNRIDSYCNLLHRPGVGLLFFIPGFEDTLRVNGIARIATDEELMGRFIVDGKLPRSVLVIEVKDAYLHCGKAIRRAGLWNANAQVDRSTFPSAGEIYRDQLALTKDVAAINEVLEQDARENLY